MKTHVPRAHAIARLAVQVFMLVLAGCTSVNHLRDAQDAFSAAATLGNEIQLQTQWQAGREAVVSNGVAEQMLRVRTLYGSALESLRALESQRKQLEADGLWGVACTLKAMTQWRLGLYDAAVETCREAKSSNAKLLPRDDALLTALPGLVRNDEAFGLVKGARATRMSADDFARVMRMLTDAQTGALAILERARATPQLDEQLEVYFLQAKLAAHANIADAWLRGGADGRIPAAASAAARAELKAFEDALVRQRVAAGDIARVTADWRLWCQLPE